MWGTQVVQTRLRGMSPVLTIVPAIALFLPTETMIKQLDPHDMDELEKLAAE